MNGVGILLENTDLSVIVAESMVDLDSVGTWTSGGEWKRGWNS